ncbi:hypothetical protein ACFQV2_33905 [Actinokineospora soli]|uniref:Uncharacterized protein n=1 Tax=Actinokineospora soli TaxID=1048753 RepID=A0ABW2TV16_9PSEU
MRRPLIVAAVAVSLASVATPVAAHPGHPGHPAPPAPPDAPVRVAERLTDLAPGWKTGDDVLVTGRGDEDGFHLYAGAENAAYAFRHVATIKPFPRTTTGSATTA